MVSVTLGLSITKGASKRACTAVLGGARVEREYRNQIVTVGDREVDVLGRFRHWAERAALEQEFAELTERWQRETRGLSAIDDIAMHPAYQRIMALGKPALPLILRELERKPHHWFWALTMIVGEKYSPVPPEHAGRVSAMRADWLQWGRDSGIID